jgi:hypothetical protein
VVCHHHHDGTSSLRRPLGCIGGQDGGSHIWIGSSSMLESCIGVGVGGHGCWEICLPRRIWRCDSIAWSMPGAALWMVGCLKDAISGSHYWDRNGMMFVPEHVCDTFATGVVHDDLDAPIKLEARTDVPRV